MPSRVRRQANADARRRVPDRVRREVLHRLFEPIAIAATVSASVDRRRRHRDAGGGARALRGARPRARRAARTGHLRSPQRAAAAFEPRQIQQIADQPLEPRRLVADDRRDSARASPRRVDSSGIGQRLEIAAHRRHRRRQLVRDVGEQLPAHAVRRGQRLGARGEIVAPSALNALAPPRRFRRRRDQARAPTGRRRRDCRAAPSTARSRRRAGPKIIDRRRAACRRSARRPRRGQHRRRSAGSR